MGDMTLKETNALRGLGQGGSAEGIVLNTPGPSHLCFMERAQTPSSSPPPGCCPGQACGEQVSRCDMHLGVWVTHSHLGVWVTDATWRAWLEVDTSLQPGRAGPVAGEEGKLFSILVSTCLLPPPASSPSQM